MIERKILIGLITNTEYLKEIRTVIDPMLIESSTAKMLTRWVLEYYDQYKRAPGEEIEEIFYKKLQDGLDKETAEEIEEEILPDLSEEYEKEPSTTAFLLDETYTYLQKRKLILLAEQIEGTIKMGKGDMTTRVDEALKLAETYKPIQKEKDETVDLSKKESEKDIIEAFEAISEPILYFPKQLGKFWNHEFIPGGFIALLAPEKRGKTWLLMEIAMRALKQGRKVAMFQAGDMNKKDVLRRISIYLTKRNTIEKYCTEHYESVRDCILNQFNECTRPERECDFGIFEGIEKEEAYGYKMPDYIALYEDNKDYKPCYNCKGYDEWKLGAPWIKRIPKCEPLEVQSALKANKEFFQIPERQFKIDIKPNSTLSFSMAEKQLDKWQNDDGFVPDIIL